MNISPTIAVPVIAALLLLMLWGVSAMARRFLWHPETARKTAHVALGLVTLSFPWVFDSAMPVLILGLVTLPTLIVVRRSQRLRTRVGGALHGVDRHSFGELYFVLAVAVVFWLAKGDPILFGVPILVLTVADAAAAIVGRRYGETKYHTLSGKKSAEGSVTVFLVTFFAAHIPLLLATDLSREAALLAALNLAILAMLFEAIAFGGLDNLFIPLGCWFALSRFMFLSEGALLIRLLILAFLLALVIGARRLSSLNGSAILGAVLLGFAIWTLGGWLFFLPLLIFFASHLIETPRVHLQNENPAEKGRIHDLRPIFAIAATSIFWIIMGEFTENPVLIAFTMSIAVHFAISSYGTHTVLRPSCPLALRIFLGTGKAVTLAFLPILFLKTPHVFVISIVFLVVLAVTAVFAFLYKGDPTNDSPRWLRQVAVVILASFVGYFVEFYW